MRRLPNWTEEEDRIAREMLDHWASDEEWRAFGRTKRAGRKRMQTLKFDHRIRETQQRRIIPAMRPYTISIPPEVIADALLRASAPRSLTAILCGDPPPQQAALYRWSPASPNTTQSRTNLCEVICDD